jgi:hypothetical protein
MEQFKVQSHIDSAEYGVVIGVVVNMLSKSGTNHFHGSVWEFIRNNDFDARNSYSDFCSTGRCAPGTPSTTPAPPLHYVQNQFGAAGGGPILHDKLFFYGAYEGWRYSKPGISQTLVPSQQELAGDFSSPAVSFYQHKFYNPIPPNAREPTARCSSSSATPAATRLRRSTTSRLAERPA